jgi:hydroxybutyrate-dimer hydrolase
MPRNAASWWRPPRVRAGIYGAIALAGSWGLAHRCAVAYTDKGAGTGYVELDSGQGARLDGSRGGAGEALEFALAADPATTAGTIAAKHAHSGDNPEADWGRHVQQAAAFALRVLDQAHPQAAPFTFDNTRVIAVGVSNGVARCCARRNCRRLARWRGRDLAQHPFRRRRRPLYDYVTEAALLMPCALESRRPSTPSRWRGRAARPILPDRALCARCMRRACWPAMHRRHRPRTRSRNCDAVAGRGRDCRRRAQRRLRPVARGGRHLRLRLLAQRAGQMPCGYSFQRLDAKGTPRAATDAERAAWWSDASGIPPGAGIGIADSQAAGGDPALPGLLCLRALWTDAGATADAVRAGVAATRAALPRPGLPVLLIHGTDDGLVPEAFSGAPYARRAQAAGRDLRYWRVRNAQHFDAFLGLPPIGASYVPMLPYAYRGLDAMLAHLVEGKPLPGDADIATRKRALSTTGLEPLTTEHLGQVP